MHALSGGPIPSGAHPFALRATIELNQAEASTPHGLRPVAAPRAHPACTRRLRLLDPCGDWVTLDDPAEPSRRTLTIPRPQKHLAASFPTHTSLISPPMLSKFISILLLATLAVCYPNPGTVTGATTGIHDPSVVKTPSGTCEYCAVLRSVAGVANQPAQTSWCQQALGSQFTLPRTVM